MTKFAGSMQSAVSTAWQSDDDHRQRVLQVLAGTQLLLKFRSALRRCRRSQSSLRLPGVGKLRDDADLTVSLLIAALSGDPEGFFRFIRDLERSLDNFIANIRR